MILETNSLLTEWVNRMDSKDIPSVALAFLIIAILTVFVAVLSKAY